jgi:hypothetical protein
LIKVIPNSVIPECRAIICWVQVNKAMKLNFIEFPSRLFSLIGAHNIYKYRYHPLQQRHNAVYRVLMPATIDYSAHDIFLLDSLNPATMGNV